MHAEVFDAAPPRPRPWRALALLAAIVGTVALVFLTGAHRLLSVSLLVENHAALAAQVSRNAALAMALYVAAYAASVALSLPSAAAFTVAGGFLFGALAGGALAVAASTIGAAGLFFIARTTLGRTLLERAGPIISRLAKGFRADAWSYLLFLRFVPVIPFWLVNLAAALFNVPFRAFITTTLIGIAPATFALAFAGAGFARVIGAEANAISACRAGGRGDCAPAFDLSAAVTGELVAALAVLGALSLAPVIAKALRRRRVHPA